MLPERFWNKVNNNGPVLPRMSTPCHEWTASLCDGYGKYGLSEGGWDRAHRVVFLDDGGVLQDGECVLHHCDNRKCVRRDHLYAGTKKDNAQDRERRGRGNHAQGIRHGCSTHPGLHRGSHNGRAKMDEMSVRALLDDHFKQGMKKAALARKYNLSKTTVGHIVSGKLWPDVER